MHEKNFGGNYFSGIYGPSKSEHWFQFCFCVLDEECEVQLNIKRNSKHSAWTGELFKIECPVKYCVHRPHVTWCKHNGTIWVPLEVGPQLYTSWEENRSVPVFVLHFKPIHLSDNGSYSCSTNFNSQVINSHSVTIHVRGKWSTPDHL